MAVVTTNLGVVTAYGDAVAAGYTGTKAEWQELMASFGELMPELSNISSELDSLQTDVSSVKEDLRTLTVPQDLVNREWAKGRYNATGLAVGSPNTSNNTFASLFSIDYDDVERLLIKDGYMASFPSVLEGVIYSGATTFITGTVTLEQIKANVSRQGGTGFVIQIRTIDSEPIPAATTPDFVTLLNPVIVNERNLSEEIKSKINYPRSSTATWAAIGDSITDGRYSYMNGNDPATDTDHDAYYGKIASEILNFASLTEYGYSSMGWVHAANDNTVLTDVLDMDFGTPDIITICLGVNDTASTITLGDETSASNDGSISGAIKNACEVLGAKYPNAQIVLLTPLNAISESTATTQWRRKYTLNGRHSLEQIADLISYWGDYYGYPVIDMLRNSPINVNNIEEMLLDGLHPSKKAHEMIACYLAGVLPRRNKLTM